MSLEHWTNDARRTVEERYGTRWRSLFGYSLRDAIASERALNLLLSQLTGATSMAGVGEARRNAQALYAALMDEQS